MKTGKIKVEAQRWETLYLTQQEWDSLSWRSMHRNGGVLMSIKILGDLRQQAVYRIRGCIYRITRYSSNFRVDDVEIEKRM